MFRLILCVWKKYAWVSFLIQNSNAYLTCLSWLEQKEKRSCLRWRFFHPRNKTIERKDIWLYDPQNIKQIIWIFAKRILCLVCVLLKDTFKEELLIRGQYCIAPPCLVFIHRSVWLALTWRFWWKKCWNISSTVLWDVWEPIKFFTK